VSEREVDDVDAERALVDGREIDGGNHGAGEAVAVIVEHLHPDQVHCGRDTEVMTAALAAVAADEASHVRAVPEAVVGRQRPAAVREIVEGSDATVEIASVTNA